MKFYIRTRSKFKDYYTKTINNKQIQNEELEEIERSFNSSPYKVEKANNLIYFKNKMFLYVPKIERNVDYRKVFFYVFVELDEEKGVDIEKLEKLLNEKIYETDKEFMINNFDVPFIEKIDNYFCLDLKKGLQKVDSINKCKKKNFQKHVNLINVKHTVSNLSSTIKSTLEKLTKK